MAARDCRGQRAARVWDWRWAGPGREGRPLGAGRDPCAAGARLASSAGRGPGRSDSAAEGKRGWKGADGRVRH
eukprot:2382715-Alexandrium_andersonii.AAC.1